MVPEYLLRVFDSMLSELERLTMGATLRTIGMPDVKTLVTPVPPIREQHKILAHIEHEMRILKDLETIVRKGIVQLREYRNSLISAAVTGKIDVREEYAQDTK